MSLYLCCVSLLLSRLILVIGACSNKTAVLLANWATFMWRFDVHRHINTSFVLCMMLLFDSRVYTCGMPIMHYTLAPKTIDTLSSVRTHDIGIALIVPRLPLMFLMQR